MDVCLPADFLHLRACVDSDWRDGCADFPGASRSLPDQCDPLDQTGPTRRRGSSPRKTVTAIQADPCWQVI